MEWWPPDSHSVQWYRNRLQCLACLKCCLAVCVPVAIALFQCHLPNLALSTEESTWLFVICGLDFQVLHSPFPPYRFPLFSKSTVTCDLDFQVLHSLFPPYCFPLFSKPTLSFLQACLLISLISAREFSFPPSWSVFAYIFPLYIQTRVVPLLSYASLNPIHFQGSAQIALLFSKFFFKFQSHNPSLKNNYSTA